jgi:hypothetical protein
MNTVDGEGGPESSTDNEPKVPSLQDFQELHNLDQRKMLKHMCTRWLSIDRCIEHLLTHWDALSDFFRAQSQEKKSDETTSKVKRIYKS